MTAVRYLLMAALVLFIGLAAMSITALLAHGAEHELCTWDISYYVLGERDRKVSKQAWLLTVEQQAQLFGPFVSGGLFVVPGEASYTCGGKKVHIVTSPLPQGSLLLLK